MDYKKETGPDADKNEAEPFAINSVHDPVLINLRETVGAMNTPLGKPTPSRPTSDHSDAIFVARLPCLGRLHIVRDKDGMLMLLGIVAYWIYGIWSSYYVIIMPHYQDGRIKDWFIYYHLIVAYLCLYSLFRASTLNPGRVPSVDDAFAEANGWEACPHCGRYRPSRAHHCRRCQQCVVRMDHHCPWINNCVGEANHHVFQLLLFYAFLFSFNTFVVQMLHFWYWPKCVACDHEAFLVKHGIWFHYLSFVMSSAMAFFMFTQFFGQHFNLLLNRTTLEDLRSANKPTDYDKLQIRTMCKAYSDHCGTRNFLLWPLPWRRKKSSVYRNVIHT